jgi:type I restriction enzyme S subunit
MATSVVAWPIVALGELLRQRKQFVQIDDTLEYKRCRVQLHAQGIVLRDRVTGMEVKTKAQQVCRAGEFLVAEIDAKVGGFGIVPDELEGAIVSSHYFLFEVNDARLDRRFLDYYIRTADFQDQVTAQGSTNYAAIRPADVLGYTIPVPQLDEQRRIVARIEALAARIAEARGLRQAAMAEAEALYRSILFSGDSTTNPTPMRELVRLRTPNVMVQPFELYQFAGVYSFGRGVFKGQAKYGYEFAYRALTRLHEGDFVYPKLMAWEGALGAVGTECDNLVVSPEFPVFAVNSNRVLPEVLDVYFRTPSVWPGLSGASTGTNVRRRRLQPTEFLNLAFPLPHMETQEMLRKVRARATAMQRLSTTVAVELDALLPSLLDKAFRGEL